MEHEGNGTFGLLDKNKTLIDKQLTYRKYIFFPHDGVTHITEESFLHIKVNLIRK